MTVSSVQIRTPLSDDEYEAVAAVLDAHSPLDIDGLSGLLHALAVCPGHVEPEAWLDVVFPDGLPRAEGVDPLGLIDRLYRLLAETVEAVTLEHPLVPEEDDVSACRAFAAGYAAGAALDESWISDPDAWTFAAHIAYLGHRFDLVPAHVLADLRAAPDAVGLIRRDLPGIINAAGERFAESRRRQLGIRNDRRARLGRNDPCPCGSGKKYKRCCLQGSGFA